jgi:hypothetical protein
MRVFILNSPVRNIRNLTSAECSHLRAEGVSCSPAWIVSPNGSESGSEGRLYSPAREGGHENTGFYALQF